MDPVSRRKGTETQLWVFGGSSGREYTDNSRALYEHVLGHQPAVEAVWLGHEESEHRTLAPARSRWVPMHGTEAYRLTRAADVVVFSHGIHDVAGLYGNSKGIVVRLGHGLTAFKNTRGRLPWSTARMVRRVDLAPVASEFERAHKAAWGFSDEQLPVTGLPRWDPMLRLRSTTADRDRNVALYAPTWRDWLGRDPAGDERFWRGIEAFTSAETQGLLRELGLEPAVFAHPVLRSYIVEGLRRIGADGVRIVTRGADLPDVLSRAALVVTDYSSLAWDALYLEIPTLFHHFDVDRYVTERAPFVDLRDRLWGPVATDDASLRAALTEFGAARGSFPDHAADRVRWSDRAFAFRDDHNCARVGDAIGRRLAAR